MASRVEDVQDKVDDGEKRREDMVDGGMGTDGLMTRKVSCGGDAVKRVLTAVVGMGDENGRLMIKCFGANNDPEEILVERKRNEFDWFMNSLALVLLSHVDRKRLSSSSYA
ncbi:hypothetical protein BPAE_0061g00400 [Botrytis paeoniae]|uniref:Uncharacterized protein n=1 Tax=Botrytis paeoniae TaxID=278948 RepID=A0A4Z1FRX6_9HELO|nr:hypothetical protein BPAE_0061g00400 [Botrytis paeoniae]